MHCKMTTKAGLGGVLLLLWLRCYGESSQVSYDYSNGPKGPANWGNLNPDWFKCKNGTMQSPIDVSLLSIVLQPPNTLDVVYAAAPVDVEIYNDGHGPTVEIVTPNSGVLTINGVVYHLDNFHFHVPSEHKLFGFRFSMEMHLVHKSTSGQIAVVAILFKLGTTSQFLSQFFGNLPPPTEPNVRTIQIRLPAIDSGSSYYRYNGSLTTPPCSEDVVWTIINYFPTLSSLQLQQLQDSIPGENARPIQLKNGRTVLLYPPS